MEPIKKAKDIIKGHLKELIDESPELSKERLEICKKCPICKKSKFGLMCDRSLWINPEDDSVSFYPRVNFIRGCGCRLNAKTRLKNAKCVAGKW